MAKRNLWETLREQTDNFEVKIKNLLNIVKSAELAIFNVVEDIYNKEVHDPREGDDGQHHMDNFDNTEFEKKAKACIDIFTVQEMCKIFSLDKSVKSRVITAYIGRHPRFRQIQPKSPHSNTQPANPMSIEMSRVPRPTRSIKREKQ